MRATRRRVVLLATLREMEATLTDAAIAMFGALVGRAHLRARKRLEQRAAVSNKDGREGLLRVSAVLEAMVRAARAGDDVAAAVHDIASLDVLDADAVIIRRTASPHRDDVLAEIAPEYRAFKRWHAPAYLRAFDFQGRASTQRLREAMAILADLDGDRRQPLPDDPPLDHIERRWRRHVVSDGGIGRTHWEMATYSALAGALASGDIWVPGSRLRRSLEILLAPPAGPMPRAVFSVGDLHACLDERAARFGTALFAGERLRFPKETTDDGTGMGGVGSHSPAMAGCPLPRSPTCCRRLIDGPVLPGTSAMSRLGCRLGTATRYSPR